MTSTTRGVPAENSSTPRTGSFGEKSEEERSSRACYAIDPDLPAHCFNETFGNYQTQTGSTMVACYGGINLTKRLVDGPYDLPEFRGRYRGLQT